MAENVKFTILKDLNYSDSIWVTLDHSENSIFLPMATKVKNGPNRM